MPVPINLSANLADGAGAAAAAAIILRAHRADAAGEVSGEVVGEVVSLQEQSLEDVVEAELSDGHEDGPAGGPVGTVEQLAEAFLSRHAHHAVDRVLVAERRGKHRSRAC